MKQEPECAETPDAFLKNIGVKLAEQDGVDSDLVSILAGHILTSDVADDAVSRAKAAILSLAQSRAKTQKEEADD